MTTTKSGTVRDFGISLVLESVKTSTVIVVAKVCEKAMPRLFQAWRVYEFAYDNPLFNVINMDVANNAGKFWCGVRC